MESKQDSDRKAIQIVIYRAVEAVISQGGVDISELDDEQAIRAALREYVKSLPEGETGIFDDDDRFFVADHSEDLLREADTFNQKGEYDFAILFYATWIEHWINEMTTKLSARARMPKEISVVLARSCSLNLKLKDLWNSFGVQPLAREVVRDMNVVMEWRNSFVHYKWKAQSASEYYSYQRRSSDVARIGKDLSITLTSIGDDILFLGRREAIKQKVLELWPNPETTGTQAGATVLGDGREPRR